MCIKASEWCYFNEGGANVVFKYQGDDARFVHAESVKISTYGLSQVGRLLRVRKRTVDAAKGDPRRYASSLPAFYAFLCESALRTDEFDRLETVKVGRECMQKLKEMSAPLRPAHRKSVADIDTDMDLAALITDYTAVQGQADMHWALIIKPKWSGIRAKIEAAKSIDHCRYCYWQWHKGRRLVFSEGDYCPADLFSQDFDRVHNCMRALAKSPSNQFQMWLNGVHVTAESCASDPFILEAVASILSQDSSILQLLKVQQELVQGLDLEALISTEADETKVLKELQDLCESKMSLNSLSGTAKLMVLMSLRDCSFAVRLVPDDHHAECRTTWKLKVAPSGVVFRYRIDFIDLDIKPTAKLTRYANEVKIFG